MQTWIFQGNPDNYDLYGSLASPPSRVIWLIAHFTNEIALGDRVYLWRNEGRSKAVAGVVAEAVVAELPKFRPEDLEGVRLWGEPSDGATAQQRGTGQLVRSGLRLVRVASSTEILKRGWMIDDPILKDLPSLKVLASTNYPVSPAQAERLDALWSRTGHDWSRDEAVAGLWAYNKTYGGAVSKLPNSPVATVALRIGRAVSGVYAKVMNFRSLDPRAAGRGMTGGGEQDKRVWAKYFDDQNSRLRNDQLNEEFERLWGSQHSLVDVKATTAAVQTEADRLGEQGLATLMAKYEARPQSKARPPARSLSARAYDRDPLVIAIGRKRANYRCEVIDCAHPTFATSEGNLYVEIHHIVPLADGGEDIIENVACICPAHHREVHLGINAQELTEQLRSLRAADKCSAG